MSPHRTAVVTLPAFRYDRGISLSLPFPPVVFFPLIRMSGPTARRSGGLAAIGRPGSSPHFPVKPDRRRLRCDGVIAGATGASICREGGTPTQIRHRSRFTY